MALFGRRKKTKQTLTKKVAKLTKMVRLQKPELKWSQYKSASTAFTGYSGIILSPLTNIAQATADYNGRIGDEITLTKMKVNLFVNQASSSTSVLGRVIVFQHKANPDGTFGIASQLNAFLHGASVGTITAPAAAYDHDNKSSYRVLKDFKFALHPIAGPGSSASMSNVTKHLAFNIRFKPKASKVNYYAAGTSVTQNEIFIVVLTDSGSSQYLATDIMTYYLDA